MEIQIELVYDFEIYCLRPYHIESTSSRLITEVKSSRLITEVKQCRAGLVLGWVTTWEYPVL